MLLLLSCAVESDAPVLVDTVPYLDGEVLVAVAGDEVAAMHFEDDNDLVEVDRIDAIGVSRFRFDETHTVRSVVERLKLDDRVSSAWRSVVAAGASRLFPWSNDARLLAQTAVPKSRLLTRSVRPEEDA